jgi:hypothetical protein
MQNQTNQQNDLCPRTDIAAYLDGELSPREEMDLELHFSGCKTCASEFNEQKKLLCALNFALDEKPELALPEDFTKSVIIKAESNVSGLRRREERFRAVFLCASLFLLIILGLGSETEAVFSTFAVFIEQIFAVGGFVAHLIFDIAFALTAILRLVGGQFIHSQLFAVLACGVFFISSGYIFSRILTLFDRSKNLETR